MTKIVPFPRRILVTGGAGYVGSTLVSQLIRYGNFVRVVDSFLFGTKSLAKLRAHRLLEVVECDLLDQSAVTKALLGIDVVVHLAGYVGDPACALNREETRRVNVLGTKHIFEATQKAQVRHFIFASSCSVYGAASTLHTEDSDLNPLSLYAETKAESELDLLALRNSETALTILRFATVFGHSLRPRFDLVANRFAADAVSLGKVCVHGGNQFRPFVHVSDVARAVRLVISDRERRRQVTCYNVGDERLTYTISGLAEVVREALADRQPVQICSDNSQCDLRNYRVSFAKIQKQFNFYATTTIEDSTREIAEYFQVGKYEHRDSKVYSNLAQLGSLLREGANSFPKVA